MGQVAERLDDFDASRADLLALVGLLPGGPVVPQRLPADVQPAWARLAEREVELAEACERCAFTLTLTINHGSQQMCSWAWARLAERKAEPAEACERCARNLTLTWQERCALSFCGLEGFETFVYSWSKSGAPLPTYKTLRHLGSSRRAARLAPRTDRERKVADSRKRCVQPPRQTLPRLN